jgi:hypothetical protein
VIAITLIFLLLMLSTISLFQDTFFCPAAGVRDSISASNRKR